MKAATIVQAHARRILATKKVKKMGSAKSGGMGLGHFANLDSQKKQKLKRDNDAEQAMGKKLGVILIRETESAQLRAALATLDAAPSVGKAKSQKVSYEYIFRKTTQLNVLLKVEFYRTNLKNPVKSLTF